ncbi:unnamed protein product [Ectocarpus sp. 4 AP-2014]
MGAFSPARAVLLGEGGAPPNAPQDPSGAGSSWRSGVAAGARRGCMAATAPVSDPLGEGLHAVGENFAFNFFFRALPSFVSRRRVSVIPTLLLFAPPTLHLEGCCGLNQVFWLWGGLSMLVVLLVVAVMFATAATRDAASVPTNHTPSP